MSVKNSAGVKLNDATELIIVADPDGTVESCYNKSSNKEFTGGLLPVTGYVELTNNKPSSLTLYFATTSSIDPSYIRAGYAQQNAGTTWHYNVIVGSVIEVPLNTIWDSTSLTGDCEIVEGSSDRLLLIKGDCAAAYKNL